jgi:beta-aspartyl-peptidase (threonine type)
MEREVCDLLAFKGMPLQHAADLVIRKKLDALQCDGGVIALTPDGQLTWSFNTPGMFRNRLREGGRLKIRLFNDEP